MIYSNSVAVLNEALTDYVNEGAEDATQFKGLQLAPAIGVSGMSGTYPKLTVGAGELGRATTRHRAPGTNFTRWSSAIESGELELQQKGEEQSVPDEVAMQWNDYFDIEALGAAEAMQRLRRGHEIDVAAALMNSTNFDVTAAAVASYSTANAATINFQRDLSVALRTLKGRGVNPNTVVIPGTIFDVMVESTLLHNFLVGSLNAGVDVSGDTLQRGLARSGITNVIVADTYVNQSDTGSDATVTSIYGNDYIWVGRVGTGGLRGGGALRTAFWDKFGPLFSVSNYREEVKKQNVIRAETTATVIVVDERQGILIPTGV